MIYSSKDMESRAVLDTAAKICAAARTAPKTRGMDGLVTCVLTGEDKSQLAAQMRKLADELDYAFFNRDADNVDASDAVVLFGMEEVRRGLDAGCQYCHFKSCADCAEQDGLCAWDAVDVGIAHRFRRCRSSGCARRQPRDVLRWPCGKKPRPARRKGFAGACPAPQHQRKVPVLRPEAEEISRRPHRIILPSRIPDRDSIHPIMSEIPQIPESRATGKTGSYCHIPHIFPSARFLPA